MLSGILLPCQSITRTLILGLSARPRSPEHSELQCKCLLFTITVLSLISSHRNFEISLLDTYLEFRGLQYLQINFRIERSIATKVFVLAVAITNCEWDTFEIEGNSNCLISRAYRDSIPHDLRRKYCIPKSRDLLWDVCGSDRCIICVLICEGQFSGRTSWIRWVLYRLAKECTRTDAIIGAKIGDSSSIEDIHSLTIKQSSDMFTIVPVLIIMSSCVSLISQCVKYSALTILLT